MGDEAIIWNWTLPDGSIVNEQSFQIESAIYTDAGDYLLHVIDADGCENNGIVNVIVNDQPVIETENPVLGCFNNTIILEETGSDAVSWEWSVPGASNNGFEPQFIIPSNFNYTRFWKLTITGANGCENFEYVEVIIQEELPIAETVNQLEVCQGSTAIFEEIGDDAVNWTWYLPNGSVVNQQSFELNFVQPSQEGFYTVVILDTYGCENTAEVELIVNESPTIEAITQIEVCENEMLNINASGTDIQSWEWSGPNGFFATTQTNEIEEATLTDSGWYYVNAIDNNGCNNTDSTEVLINNIPQLNIQNGDSANVLLGESIELQLNIIDNGAINNIEWQPNENIDANDIANPTVSPTENTLYVVTVENEYGCISTSEIFVHVEMGVGIEAFNHNINIYPNPTSNIVTFNGLEGKSFILSIYNSLGELLIEEHQNNEINLAQFPEGVYYYTLDLEEDIVSGSIIKLK